MKRVATFLVAVGLLAAVPVPQAFATPGSSLNRRLPETKFNGVSFGDAVDFVRDVSGANITVNWRALAEAGVTPETPLNLRLYNVSLRRVLSAMLAEAGGGTDGLTYVLDDGVIEITTRALADQRMIVRVYNVEDLIMEIPDFGDDVPDFNLQSTSGSGGGRNGGSGGGGSSGGGLFGGGNSGNSSSSSGEKTTSKTKNERAQELIDLIINTVRPDIWRENGGTASIRYFNGNLIVSAPLSVQEAIGG